MYIWLIALHLGRVISTPEEEMEFMNQDITTEKEHNYVTSTPKRKRKKKPGPKGKWKNGLLWTLFALIYR